MIAAFLLNLRLDRDCVIELQQASGEYSLRAGDFGLTFAYRRDRWQHRLDVRDAGHWTVLTTSAEGPPDEAVPVSPAFQDLRLEQRGDDVYEFQLFGQAGQGTYSAAVRFDGTERSITFDLCARPGRAGAAVCDRSTYDVPVGVVLSSEPGALILKTSAGSDAVVFRSVGFGRREKDQIGGVWTEIHTTLQTTQAGSDRRFAIAAGGTASAAVAANRPVSVRWQFQVQVVGSNAGKTVPPIPIGGP